MAPLPVKSNKAGTLKSETDQQSSSEVKESNNLWVGNISREVADSDLMELFAQFGALDSVTTYSARSYAFVYFKHVEDAKQAKDALQGTSLRGNQIKIEFARPAKPSKYLWVGGISSSVSEERLEEEFLKFGKIEDFKFLRDRKIAYVEYLKLEDAFEAMKNMNGKKIGGDQIRVDFLRSQSTRREQLPDFLDSREDQFSATPYGVRRPQLPQSLGGRKDGQPSNILSVDEARRAKEGLQGRLFNDPRITIMFSSSGLAPGKEYSSFYPGVKGGEFNDLAPSHSTRDTASGILPSPASGIRPSMRSVSSGWDVLDPSQFPREAKRSRIDAAPSVDDDSFPARKMDDRLRVILIMISYGGGIVAKGGTPVCHARCVPVGKGIESEIPHVINCSARTGLDMLAKHYAEAIGFDIVFFLPDSEEDFASYTEFLRYLGLKNRAGVAKFDDGTTLFLVPPSDFLKNVLKVAGPERLYGVVLKLPQQGPGNTSMQEQLPQSIHFSQYTDNQIPPPEADYNQLRQGEERSPLQCRQLPQEYASNHGAAPSTAGVLTPELIATLATLLPTNKQPSSSESSQQALGSSIVRPPFSSVAPDRGNSSQGWKHDNQVSGNASHLQMGNQFNSQLQVQSQFQPYPSVPNTYSHSATVVPSNSQIQDSTVSLSHQSITSSRPLTSYSMPSQSGQFALSPQVQGTNYSQTQSGIPPSADRGNWELPGQVQQFQPALSGSGQGSSEVEADKNQRYQSTLQFAANLLLQIQQQQQQKTATNPAAHGSGNQQ
ncbi:FLOWERING TIME CONTROL PROTEIN FPA [Salix purpurea]|uniref:FLOWERING TIME CONTROL PROTEIN FPA n=1 Tax=Salix purpurea TaxID=77065 RepID=A0A9Q0UQH0_SALPP|nr:FLOWERING TIME CONTROL PROTEIN FPA [Salix purpurea]